jgi:site-specific DNA recombinase
MRRSKPGDPRTAVAYVRVSTDDQALGPEAQKRSINAYAAAQGITVVEWHSDLGVSGALPPEARPGLMAAIGALATVGAGLLIAAKRDRLGRDLIATAMLERLAQRAGARVVTADGLGAGDTPEAALMRSLIDAFATYEVLVLRARTRAALDVKRSRGERIGHVPYGYAVAPDGVRLIELPEEQAAIAHVRRLRSEGVTLRAIVARLNVEPWISAARGARFHMSLVARIAKPGRAQAA